MKTEKKTRHRLLLWSMVCLVAIACAGCGKSASPDTGDSLTAASFNEKTATGVVLVDFYADWCPPCKALAPVLEEIAKEKAGEVSIVKVNVDHNEELASSYQISSIPHLILFKDGKVVDSKLGFQEKQELLNWINQ